MTGMSRVRDEPGPGPGCYCGAFTARALEEMERDCTRVIRGAWGMGTGHWSTHTGSMT
jgi:hypothetical protein